MAHAPQRSGQVPLCYIPDRVAGMCKPGLHDNHRATHHRGSTV
nr:MAG TPA: hypothetical protein [Caudoviricetes sp.]